MLKERLERRRFVFLRAIRARSGRKLAIKHSREFAASVPNHFDGIAPSLAQDITLEDFS